MLRHVSRSVSLNRQERGMCANVTAASAVDQHSQAAQVQELILTAQKHVTLSKIVQEIVQGIIE